MGEPEFAVVIPCFNEENGLEVTVRGIIENLAGCGAYKIIIVNDGSSDRTAQLMDELAEKHPEITLVHHPKQRGYGAALKTGFRRTKAPLAAIIDADGTYPSRHLPKLLEEAKEADMVVGARTAEEVKYPFIKKIPKTILRLFSCWLARQNIPDINSGLRVMRRAALEKYMNMLPDGFSFTTTITLAMMTNHYDVRFMPIEYYGRIGRSKIRPIRDTLNIFLLIVRIGTYFAPLRVFMPAAGLIGLGFLASLLYDVLALRNLTDKTVILFFASFNATVFALLADMIDKRTDRSPWNNE